jgi:tRNA (guanine10-N2)-methyltransferase
MDAEVSLLMANQALVRIIASLPIFLSVQTDTQHVQASAGKLVYDPFVGTGSMLYTSAHWGAFVVGSDIDGRHIRGKGTKYP